MKKKTPSGDADVQLSDPYAATQLHADSSSLSRQEEDIALAAELLKSGYVNDRELSAAISDWSMHGNIPLGKHLAEKRVLALEQIAQLQSAARDRVDKLRQSLAAGSEVLDSGGSLLLATLERLDGSGRVAKLLGVTVAASSGGDDTRTMEGRFALIRKIGQGGLGRVWLARDVNLNRYVALKEISHGSASDTTVQRFRREAEITGRLDHPSIVPIHQLGQDVASGRMFYTMRFLGRSTLQDAINEYHERRQEDDDDPMLLRHLLTAFVNVCHAMGHAHSRKVIHRDLKPENVVIDSFGQVIVIDWGLAKVIEDHSVESVMESTVSESSEQTLDGQVLGTPLFMAPEQAAGRLDELDQRTDVFGLGAILFSIITGSAPHEQTQKEAIDSGVGRRGMISVIAAGAIPNARQINPAADPALEAICHRAMSRRRYGRYQEAAELAEDVQRWMAGEPVSALAETTSQRFGRWLGQHRTLSQFLLASAMIAIVALTTLGMSARHNQMVALRTRYGQMLDDAREVEEALREIAMELSADVRFLASLPPVQGVIQADGNVDGDSAAVWRDRLASIYQSMLRTQPNYLALSYEARAGDGAMDVVRVERNAFDPTLIRNLPIIDPVEVESDSLMSAVGLLEPGDVKLVDQVRPRHESKPYVTDRLCVATPIVNERTGEWFGMTVIEADIKKQVMAAVERINGRPYQLYVSDGAGELLISYDPQHGVRLANKGEKIPTLPDDVKSKLSVNVGDLELQKDDQYYFKRFYVDPTGRGISIFGNLAEMDRK